MATLTPSGRTMNMTLPASASIALCRMCTTIGNAIEYTQSEQQRIYIDICMVIWSPWSCRCHMQRIRHKMKRYLTKYKFTLHQMVPNAKRRSSWKLNQITQYDTLAHKYQEFSTAYQQRSFLNNTRRDLGYGFDFCVVSWAWKWAWFGLEKRSRHVGLPCMHGQSQIRRNHPCGWCINTADKAIYGRIIKYGRKKYQCPVRNAKYGRVMQSRPKKNKRPKMSTDSKNSTLMWTDHKLNGIVYIVKRSPKFGQIARIYINWCTYGDNFREKRPKQSPKGCKRLIGLLLAANNQATRRNEIIRS